MKLLDRLHLQKLMKLENCLSIGAMIVAVISLIIAYSSWSVANDALDDSRLQFRQERQLVLKGIFYDLKNEKCVDWGVAPIAEGFQYQQGRVILPPSIDRNATYIEANGRVRFLHGACWSIQHFAERRMKPKQGFVSVSEGDIPIILESSYAVKGEAYNDTSLYLLHVIAGVPHGGEGQSTVTFTGLSFVERLLPSTVANPILLDKLLNSKTNNRIEATS